jgi:protein-tyrosine phosphatase
MLEIAAASGTSDIVATPHANAVYHFDPEQIDRQIRDLSAIGGVRVHRGCDFHLQYEAIEDAIANPRKYTINGNGYLLIEFPELTIFPGTDEILEQLLDAGMIPIVTHPERNQLLRKRTDDLARWIELGCYVQVTAGSFTGVFGRTAKSSADELLSRGLVHFVASDAHDTRRRPPDVSEAYAVLAERWGEPAIRPLFVDNPGAVLTGEAIDAAKPAAPTRRRQWYQFWG